MSFREKYQQQKEDLMSRQKEQAQTSRKERWGSIIVKEKVPAGIEIWKEGEGTKKIDILPFPAGPNHPQVILGAIPVGKFVYDIELVEHTNIGVNNDSWCCNTTNFKEPDPVCMYVKSKRLPKEEWTKLKGKRRNIYLVWDHTTPEEEAKGVQIWMISYFFFGEKIDEIVKIPGRTGIAGCVPFFDPDEGKSIIFTKKAKDKQNFEYLGHRFIDRPGPIPDDILKQADFHLDSCIKVKPSFEEVYLSFYGKPYKEGVLHVPVHLASASAAPAQTTEAPPSGGGESDVPFNQSTEVSQANSPRLARSPSMVCPAGGTFGTDFNTLAMCQEQDKCQIWDNCADVAMKSNK